MSDKKQLVAVYGTLRKHCGNHGVMERAGGVFIKSEMVPGVRLHDYCGSFPAVAVTGDVNDRTLVEIYEVDNMQPLDRLEGYSGARGHNFYDREVVSTSVGEVFIYSINDTKSPVIPHGDWVAHKYNLDVAIGQI